MKVLHDNITSPLVVEGIVYKNVTLRDGTRKKYTVGVKCHWVENGTYSSGLFHTNELKPYLNDIGTG